MWQWQLFEPVCSHLVSFRWGDLIVHGGSVCSLYDLWPLHRDRGQPVQISPETRPWGVCNVLVEPAETTVISSADFVFICLFALRQKHISATDTNIKRKNMCISLSLYLYINKILSQGVNRKDSRYLSQFLTVGSFPLHLRAETCLRWGEHKQTTNYTWETKANIPKSKPLTPRKCCSLPHNEQFPPQLNKI